MQSEIILEQDPRERPKSSDERYLALVWRRFKRNKLALVSMWLILAMLILAATLVIGNLIADVALALLDPRVRLS